MPAPTDNTPNGKDLKAYYNTGTQASPVWAELKRIENLSHSLAKNTGTLKIRGSKYEKIVPGQQTRSIAFNYVRKRGTDTVFAALKDSYENDSHVQIALTDIAIATSGAAGVKAWYVVTKFDEKQDLENPWQVDVELGLVEHFESGNEIEPEAIATP